MSRIAISSAAAPSPRGYCENIGSWCIGIYAGRQAKSGVVERFEQRITLGSIRRIEQEGVEPVVARRPRRLAKEPNAAHRGQGRGESLRQRRLRATKSSSRSSWAQPTAALMFGMR